MGLIKTTVIVVGGVALTGALLASVGPLSSYLRTSARVAGQAAHDAVPTSFEVERIQTLVDDLDQVIGEQQARLVKQRVDLDYLQQEVRRAEQRQGALADEVRRARSLLQHERAVYRIGEGEYARGEVVREAQAKAQALMRAREIHDAKSDTLAALDGALAQAEAQLAEARRQRSQYQMRLAQLRAKAENVAIRQELATTLDQLPERIDAGAFQEVEDAFGRVERELTVQDRLLNERYQSAPDPSRISFVEPDERDVLAQLDQALTDEPEPAALPAPSSDETDAAALIPADDRFAQRGE